MPLLLCHGRPGSILELRHLIGPPTDPVAHGGDPGDAFHLVIPSKPGFGFSGKPTTTGWNVSRVADAWITLMQRLGYDSWFAQGGDWGAAVVEQITRTAPERCRGVHSTCRWCSPPHPAGNERGDPAEQRMMARARHYQGELDAYAREQATRPQTIGYSLADSPAGLAAWIYTLFQDVTDRLYWEDRQSDTVNAGPGEPNPVPAGFSIFPGEAVQASRRWIERRYKTVLHYARLEHGGHFAVLEQPVVLTEQIRTTFRDIRRPSTP